MKPESVEEPDIESLPDDKVVLQGRSFLVAKSTTFEQDIYLMTLMRESRITKLFESAKKEALQLDAISEGIVSEAYESGKLFEILGAGMVEEGQAWSRKASHENALFFASLMDKDDKEKLFPLVAAMVVSFFLNAPGSSEILSSLSVGVANESASPISDPPKSESSPLALREINEESTILESGGPSLGS